MCASTCDCLLERQNQLEIEKEEKANVNCSKQLNWARHHSMKSDDDGFHKQNTWNAEACCNSLGVF